MTGSTHVSPTWKLPPSEPVRARLAGQVLPIAALTAEQVDQLYALLTTYFEGVTRQRFEADLAEKEWAVLLTDPSGQIRGFSTLMRLVASIGGERVVAYFSGDTIIHRAFWGQSELPRIWARHALSLAAREQGARVYWYLISSGYKTYRFLPVFFRRFWPRPEESTPPREQAILHALGQLKFPGEYDPATGVIRFAAAAPLRDGVAEVTEGRLQDPYVAFFEAANPGHSRGDELACLTELTPENLTRAGRRMMGLPAIRRS